MVYLIKVAVAHDLKQQHMFDPRSLRPLIPQTSKRSALKFDILTEPARIIVRITTDCMLYILMSNTLPRFYTFPLSGITNELSDDFIKKSAKSLNQAILLVSLNRKID